MLEVFTDVVIPVIVVVAVGGAVGRWRKAEVASLSGLVFYLFGPALVFTSISTTELSAGLGLRIVAVICISGAAMFALATIWSAGRRHRNDLRAGFALAAMAPNVGNMGLPIATLAFGDLGLQVAVIAFVISAVFTNSVGIAVASMAGGDRRAAWIAPFRYPFLYAGALGVFVRAIDLELPTMAMAPLETLSGATVPLMLVVLGLQLRNVIDRVDITDTIGVVLTRLTIAPFVGFVTASLLGIDGVERATLTVLAGMPTAVITTILATQFGARPDFVTRGVITSTVLSFASLTVLITILR